MKYQLFIVLTVAVMGCGIWNKSIWIFMWDYVRPLGLTLDMGRILYKAVGSKLGCIIIITFLVIHSVPLITPLEIYYSKLSQNMIGINSVLIQENVALTFIFVYGKE